MLSETPSTRASLGLLDRELRRRDFLKFCTLAAAAVGLPLKVAEQFAEAAVLGKKPSVIWLHFQECTGCTESLLRAEHPTLEKLILDVISLDYHETLMAASGTQAEDAARRLPGRLRLRLRHHRNRPAERRPLPA